MLFDHEVPAGADALSISGQESNSISAHVGGLSPSAPVRVAAGDDHRMSPAEAESARRLGERIRAELAALVQSFPIEKRAISEMARWLGVTRPICQRAVRCVRHRGDGLGALTQLPGVQGLAGFVQAARDRGCPAGVLASADAALVSYANLIDKHGGSQARLIAAIEAVNLAETAGPLLGAVAGNNLQARQRVFEGIKELIGREFDTQLGVFIYRPHPDNANLIDCVTAMGMIGVRRGEGAMPICPVSTFSYGRPEGSADGIDIGELGSGPAPIGTLDRFCSSPRPPIIARRTGGRVPVLLDPDRACVDPIDVVLVGKLNDLPHPGLDDPKIQLCSIQSDGPSKRLIMVVYMHRSLAMASVASAGTYARDQVGDPRPGPDGSTTVSTPDQRWHDRMPDRLGLDYLGLGLDQIDTPGYARLGELTEHLFDVQGWSPGEFVGYRCQVDYPVWNTQHLICFDFSPEDGDGDG